MIAKNNPLNLRYKSCNIWSGQLRPVKGFCSFKSLYYGYRAAIMLIFRYRSFGCCSIRSVVSRWYAPDSNKNIEDIISFVCNYMGVPDSYVLIDDVLYPFLSAMTRIEKCSYSSVLDRELRNTLFLLNLPCVDSQSDIF